MFSNNCKMSTKERRITFKRARPNPLFQEWLEELYEDAKKAKSKLEPMLREALDSLSKYPLPLKSGAECAILKGFEKKLCTHLDKRLEVYKYNLSLAQATETASNCSSRSSGRNTNCSSPMSDIQNVDKGIVQTQLSKNKSDKSIKSNTQTSNDNINSQETVVSNLDNSLDSSSSSTKTSGRSKNKKYKPAHRSGGYALLRALFEHSKDKPNDASLTKEELIDKAQIHSEESFVRPRPDTFYTAWSSISRLVTKGLVTKVRHKKVKYLLTAEGIELAKELISDSKNIPTVNDIIFKDAPTASAYSVQKETDNLSNASPTASQSTNSVIELAAGSFDIVLLIDKNETGGVSKKNDPTVAQFNKYNDLFHEYRSLKIGDFTWIARHKWDKDQELVLPYIVERKRMDDLGASIKDGRFHEQKFRLRKCGLRNVIYLIENYGGNKHVGLPIQHLMQAIANTRVQDDFKVHVTDSLTNSVKFLAMMTKRLTIRYKDKNLKGWNDDANEETLMTFEYFNQASIKSKALTVTETFIKLLLQLKGVSVEKALAITAKYSTPRSLIIAYQKCDRSEGEGLLACLKYGDLGRNVGPVISKAIYQLFSVSGSDNLQLRVNLVNCM